MADGGWWKADGGWRMADGGGLAGEAEQSGKMDIARSDKVAGRMAGQQGGGMVNI